MGRGYFDARAAFSPEALLAHAEIGYHPVEDLALFAYGEAGSTWGGRPRAGAGLGLRYLFGRR